MKAWSFAAAALLAACPAVSCAEAQAQAQAQDPPLYVLATVFTDGARTAPREATAYIASGEAGDYFRRQFAASFSSVTSTITPANQRRTFVVSLQAPRLSEYEVRKVNGVTEHQFAMTGSLYFTNIASGEVLFTYTATRYGTKRAATAAGDLTPAQRADAWRAVFADLVGDLVSKSRAAFKPFEITTTVRDVIGPLAVLDRGAAAGLGQGDALGNPQGELRTVFTDAQYAVAEPQLGGRVQTGSQWSKYSTRTLALIDKPTAVVVVADNNSPFPDPMLGQMVSDAAGDAAPLALTPVNADFSQVMDAVRQQTDIRADATTARRLPDFVIRLSAAAPITYELPTNLAYKTLRVANARVFIEVVDRIGRVEFAGYGEDTLRDEVTEGMSYDPQARAEVVVRNAILDGVRKMAKAIKLDRSDLKIRAVTNGSVTAADEAGLLRIGAPFTVLHPAGQVSGVSSTVFAPTWSGAITELRPGEASGELSLPVYQGAPAPRTADVLRVERLASAPPRDARRVAPCGNSESLGARRLESFEALALNTFAASTHQQTDLSSFMRTATAALEATGQFKDASGRPRVTPAAVCFEPVQRIDLGPETCKPDGICSNDINLRLTYRLKRNGEVIYRGGLESVVHSSAYPRATAAADRDALIDADVAKAAGPLLHSILETPDYVAALKTLAQ